MPTIFSDAKCLFPLDRSRSESASVFNAFDQELTALGKQLEHLIQQKRGLMQKLLTGEWRVAV